VVDGLVMTVINNGSIRKEDFNKQENGAYLLDKDSFKRFLGYYEERMEKLFIYREQDSQTSYRKLFQLQAEKIQKSVLNKEEYQPFLVR
jgi:CRISPR-associated protein Cas1